MRTVIFLILLCITSPTWAQTSGPSPQQLLERFQQRFNASAGEQSIQTVEADFYQKAHIASLNRTQTARGTMAMKFVRAADTQQTETLFHWQYSVPNQQQVVSDGQNLWVYLPDNNQVMVSEVNDESYYSEDPLLFLRNLGQLSQHFSVVWGVPQRNNDEDYLLQLTPKESSVYIKTLMLAVPKWLADTQPQAGFPLHMASVLDPTGNTTEIEFRAIKINQSSTRKSFTFVIPEGVDSVRPSDLTVDFK
ncbi:MAG: hypothetical protein B6I37_04940 [Desulfobacteraceae bacterium 4572_35.2]|nr:MAG: hypothetical protein B6I37_04940 [Desulfobacteraceae bacterium 4572_35.2]